VKIASCVRTLVCPAEWIREGSGLSASAARQPPWLRSHTTPRTRGRVRVYHHRAGPAAAIATLLPTRLSQDA